MEICKRGHAEIVHDDGWNGCPACNLMEKHDEEIDKLQKEIAELKEIIDNTP